MSMSYFRSFWTASPIHLSTPVVQESKTPLVDPQDPPKPSSTMAMPATRDHPNRHLYNPHYQHNLTNPTTMANQTITSCSVPSLSSSPSDASSSSSSSSTSSLASMAQQQQQQQQHLQHLQHQPHQHQHQPSQPHPQPQSQQTICNPYTGYSKNKTRHNSYRQGSYYYNRYHNPRSPTYSNYSTSGLPNVNQSGGRQPDQLDRQNTGYDNNNNHRVSGDSGYSNSSSSHYSTSSSLTSSHRNQRQNSFMNGQTLTFSPISETGLGGLDSPLSSPRLPHYSQFNAPQYTQQDIYIQQQLQANLYTYSNKSNQARQQGRDRPPSNARRHASAPALKVESDKIFLSTATGLAKNDSRSASNESSSVSAPASASTLACSTLTSSILVKPDNCAAVTSLLRIQQCDAAQSGWCAQKAGHLLGHYAGASQSSERNHRL